MTSQEFDTSGGSGGIMATESSSGGIVMTELSDSDVVYEVKSLKALSLNGLDKGLNPATASIKQDGVAMTSSSTVNTLEGIGTTSTSTQDDPTSMISTEVLKPRLSWGNVTEIPDVAGADSDGSHTSEKYRVNEKAWQVRSTQNPSRPLVRRPTPMAISVPKSVLGKGSSKIMTGSFEEGEEEQEESFSPVPVSLRKRETKTDVLVVEDIVEEEEEEEDVGCREELQAPTDLPIQSAVNAASLQNANLNVVSPTIVVQTTFGKEMTIDEAEELKNNNQEKKTEDAGQDDGEEEEARGELDDTAAASTDSQILSLDTKAEVYERHTKQVISNTHAQTSPSQKRKLVRRMTPIALDLPEDVKVKDSLKTSTEILEEEEEEEDEIEPSATSVSSAGVLPTPIGEFREEDKEEEQAGERSVVETANCNNNHHHATNTSSRDVVDGMDSDLKKSPSQSTSTLSSDEHRQGLFRKSASIDGRHTKQYLSAIASSKVSKGHFRKSASCDKSDGRRSPLSAMRKVSPHHTKILTRQQTPIEIVAPKSVLSDAVKAKGKHMTVEEGAEDEN